MAIPVDEVLFLDTSILVDAMDELRPSHGAARRLIARGHNAGLHGATSRDPFQFGCAHSTFGVNHPGYFDLLLVV